MSCGLSRAPAPALSTVADIPLPGGSGRFDYQTLDPVTGRLYIAHMGPGRLLVIDTKRRAVIADIEGFPRATGVCAVPSAHCVYVSVPGRHSVAVLDALGTLVDRSMVTL